MRNFSIPDTQKKLYNESPNKKLKVRSASPLVHNLEEAPNQNFAGSLPPFDVLLSWLTYTYNQTGEWPLPPTAPALEMPNDHQNLSLDACSSIEDGVSSRVRETGRTTDTENNKNKGLWIVSGEETSQNVKSSQVLPYSTGFDYVNSVYFIEATRLIEKYANPFIEEELLFGCKRVLSLIIAWCHFTLFSEWSNRRGCWMILATAHCARELKMRIASFKDCVAQLEETGLIVTGQAGADILTRPAFEQLQYDCSRVGKDLGKEAATFWSRHSVQSKTIVYGLPKRLELDATLPAFNPFVTGKDLPAQIYEEWEGHQDSLDGHTDGRKTVASNGKDQEGVSSKLSVQFGSFPGVPCYDELIHDVDETITYVSSSERTDSESSSNASCSLKTSLSSPSEFTAGLTPQQKLKFEFLNNQASFAGYCRKDGRATLDTPEALRFALVEQLTFEQIELRYSQVNEMWSKGYCKKNPIGLLHWAITQNCDPRGYDDKQDTLVRRQQEEHSVFEAGSVFSEATEKPLVTTSKSYSSYFTPDSNNRLAKGNYSRFSGKNNRSNNAGGAKKVDRSFSAALKLIEERHNRVEDFTVGEALQEELLEVAPTQPASLPEDLTQLWREIVDYNLSGRFRLNSQDLANLSNSRLELVDCTKPTQSQRQLQVVLRSVVEESGLGLTTRNTIRLAVRQRIGSGYDLVFTSPG